MANSLSEMVQYAQAIQANSPLRQISQGVAGITEAIKQKEEKLKKDDMELAEKVSQERRERMFFGMGDQQNRDKTQGGLILAKNGEAPNTSNQPGPMETMAMEFAKKYPNNAKLTSAVLSQPATMHSFSPEDKVTYNSEGEFSVTRGGNDTTNKTRLTFDPVTREYKLSGTEQVVDPNNFPNAIVDRVTPDKPEKNYHYIDPVTKDVYINDPSTGELVKGAPKQGSVAKMMPVNPQLREDTKNLAQYQDDALQALVALNKIERYAGKLGDFGKGAISQTVAKGTTAYKRYAKEENVTMYEGAVSQEFIPMARKLMEEKGPITEYDVARVEKGFGDITTPLAQKKKLIEELRAKVRTAIASKLEQTGQTMEDLKTKNPTLYGMLQGTNTGGNSGVAKSGRRFVITPSK